MPFNFQGMLTQVLSQHMWAKADVVGGDRAPVKIKPSHSPAVQPSPKRNGSKHALSDAIVKSESDDDDSEPESLVASTRVSNESRFSDSEDDR